MNKTDLIYFFRSKLIGMCFLVTFIILEVSCVGCGDEVDCPTNPCEGDPCASIQSAIPGTCFPGARKFPVKDCPGQPKYRGGITCDCQDGFSWDHEQKQCI